MPPKPRTSLSKKEPDGFLNISLNLTLGIGGATIILALALIVVHFFSHQAKYRESLNFMVTTFATAAGICTAVYALRGIQIGLEDKKIDRTLRYIQVWNDPSYFNARKLAAEINNDLKNLDDYQRNNYINQLYANTEKKQEIVNVLNFLEEMSTCIHEGLVYEGYLKEFYRYILRNYCETFKLFIDTSRREKDSPRLYIHLTELSEQWGD